MNFKLWIEIQKSASEKWYINAHVYDHTCYDEKFFIEGAPHKTEITSEGTFHSQTIKFNPLLLKEIKLLLFPDNGKGLSGLTEQQAWDFYHYTVYEKFTFNVHPISISSNFFRQEFEGTQEEIYEVCKRLNEKWIKR